MLKKGLSISFYIVFALFISENIFAQQTTPNNDTFFLVKKKGLLGKLGKSIAKGNDNIDLVNITNPYLQYAGKIIRSIRKIRLGFERDINDSTKFNRSFGVIVANAFHRKTTERVIKNNLFFEVGDLLNPYLLSDNERHLREQPFLQDAIIRVENKGGSKDSVDVTIITKEVFSLGADVEISSATKYRVGIKEENLMGNGSRLLVSSFFDNERNPKFGYGAEFLKRNFQGSFVNWTVGFQTYKNTFNTGRNEEGTIYFRIEKPLVTPYIPWVGSIDFSINKTSNGYNGDSLYKSDFIYAYNNLDGWFGYNFGAKKFLKDNKQSRVRKFIAVRGIYKHFNALPENVQQNFDYRFTNISGFLTSMNLFEQNFYRTKFIYGFGRHEDVPQGFSASLIGGIIRKRDSISTNSRQRPYFAIEGQRSRFNKRGYFSTYTFRLGGYSFNQRFEDVSMLFNVEHFTRLKKIDEKWYFRQFHNFGFTRQLSPVLNQPLYLRSTFGLPYFNNDNVEADLRATARTEAVFYNLKKYWGFRFAPFIFTDACLVKATYAPFEQSQLYGAIGAGVRTRNENMIFGTIELRGFYFPKTAIGMGNWKVEVGTNIRFKYSSVFIKRPDFIVDN